MTIKDIIAYLRKFCGYWQLDIHTRLLPGFEVGVFTYYMDKLVATLHVTGQGKVAITPVSWEGDSWSHAGRCKIVSVDGVPEALYFLLDDREGFFASATGCVRCQEANGIYEHYGRLYCEGCRQKRNAEIQARHAEEARAEEYTQILKERSITPKGCVAGCFQIPWSQLKEVEYDGGFYVTDTASGHTWRIPFKGLFDFNGRWMEAILIHEIDADKQPVTTYALTVWDIQRAIESNGEFVTEMEKPNHVFAILGPS